MSIHISLLITRK